MKIAICDDSMKDLITLEGMLETYKKLNPNAAFQVEKFSDSSALYEKIQKKEDIVIIIYSHFKNSYKKCDILR